MRLLVLGGTVFLGHALVTDALARGWEVTTFSRGRSGDPVPGAEAVLGDRSTDLGRLAGRTWDAVVDTCGFDPEVVAASAAALADSVASYTFISSMSVYPGEMTESAPVFTSGRGYGEDKAASERAVDERFPGRALHVRAGLLLGPRENIGRLPWWLQRIARGGDVLAPGRPERPLQYVDVRDLAAWTLDAVERGRTGPVNVASQPGHATMGELLATAADVVGSGARLVWLPQDELDAAGIEPWTELPCWVPEAGELAEFLSASVDRAYQTGLTCRPVGETVAATWQWLQDGGVPVPRPGLPPVGLAADKEAAALAAHRE